MRCGRCGAPLYCQTTNRRKNGTPQPSLSVRKPTTRTVSPTVAMRPRIAADTWDEADMVGALQP
jgi:hypothetical protein